MRCFFYKTIFLIVLIGCSESSKNNSELIKEIDSIKEKTIIYKYEVDSIGRIIDTLSVEKIKKNDNDVIILSDKLIFTDYGYLKIKKYFRDNKNLFYSISESSEIGILSIIEFWDKNEDIIKGISLDFRDNKVKDTIKMTYKYTHDDNGLKTKLIIQNKYSDEDVIASKTEITYNDLEEIVAETTLLYGDTISVSKFSFSRNLLKKKSIKDYKNNVLIRFNYDKKGYVSSRETYISTLSDSLIKISNMRYSVDELGRITDIVETQLSSNKKKYFLYKYD